MSTANQQTLAESGASDRPLILKKGSYVPWASRVLRFLDNKKEEGELMRHSIDEGPHKRKQIPDLNDDTKTILKPINKMSSHNNQYYADINVTTLINIMDRNGVLPKEIIINTMLLSSLQPEWSKYVTMTHQKYVLGEAHYDELYDHLTHVNASKEKNVARNHEPSTLVANSHAYSSHSYASPSYSYSPQLYYVTYPSLLIDYEDDYHGKMYEDTQEDKLTSAMMLLERAITQRWRVCIDYRKLNDATRKDHFPLSFIDQMLEQLSGNEYYCFLDGFSGFFQISIAPEDEEKTTFTYPYGTLLTGECRLGYATHLQLFKDA
nr:RNA-directed DNA polymerase homolog [Tanacetum cinerariifolium]